MRVSSLLPFLVVATLCGTEPAGAQPPARERLPEGALLRLGSDRLRHPGGATEARFLDPDGRRIVSVGSDRRVRVHDGRDGRLLFEGRLDPKRPVPTTVTGDTTADGEAIFAATADGALFRLDPPEGEPAAVVDTGLRMPRFSETGRLIAGTDREPSRLRVCDREGREVAVVETEGRIAAHGFSADDRYVVVAAWIPRSRREGRTKVWRRDLRSEAVAVLDAGETFCRALAVSPDGSRALLAASDGTTRLADFERGVLGEPVRALDGSPASAAWSPDGGFVAVGGTRDRSVALLDGESGEFVHRFRAHAQAVVSVRFDAQGGRLLTASLDGRVRVFDPATGDVLLSPAGHTGAVRDVAWSPDGGVVATGGFDGTVRLWDAETGEERTVVTIPLGAVQRIAFDPKGERLALACQDGHLRLLDPTEGAFVADTAVTEMSLLDVAWSPDGTLLAAGAADGKVRLFEGKSGRLLAPIDVGGGFAFAVAWAPDGSALVAGTSRLYWIDPEQAMVTRDLDLPRAPVTGLAFSPNGDLFCASADRRVIRIDPATGGVEAVVAEHTSRVSAFALAPDGKLAASAGLGEKGFRLFDPESGEIRAEREGHAQLVLALAFSPDGRRIVSGSGDATALVWSVE